MANLVTIQHKVLKDKDGKPRQVTVPPSAAKVLEASGWKAAPKGEQPTNKEGN